VRLFSEAADDLIQQSALCGIANFKKASLEERWLIEKFKFKVQECVEYPVEISFVQRVQDTCTLVLGIARSDAVAVKEQTEAFHVAAEHALAESGWKLQLHPIGEAPPTSGEFLLFSASQTAAVASCFREDEDFLRVEAAFHTSFEFALFEQFDPVAIANTLFLACYFYYEHRYWREALFFAEEAESLVELIITLAIANEINPYKVISVSIDTGVCFENLDLPERAIAFAERNIKGLETLLSLYSECYRLDDLFEIFRSSLQDWKDTKEMQWKRKNVLIRFTDSLFKRHSA
jgi:hypothetical protein